MRPDHFSIPWHHSCSALSGSDHANQQSSLSPRLAQLDLLHPLAHCLQMVIFFLFGSTEMEDHLVLAHLLGHIDK